MMPPCDHTGTPRHFHSSTTSGSAALIRARSRASVLPRQSPSSAILASINSDGDSSLEPLFFMSSPRSCHLLGRRRHLATYGSTNEYRPLNSSRVPHGIAASRSPSLPPIFFHP